MRRWALRSYVCATGRVQYSNSFHFVGKMWIFGRRRPCISPPWPVCVSNSVCINACLVASFHARYIKGQTLRKTENAHVYWFDSVDVTFNPYRLSIELITAIVRILEMKKWTQLVIPNVVFLDIFVLRSKYDRTVRCVICSSPRYRLFVDAYYCICCDVLGRRFCVSSFSRR